MFPVDWGSFEVIKIQLFREQDLSCLTTAALWKAFMWEEVKKHNHAIFQKCLSFFLYNKLTGEFCNIVTN